jgi:hypothetical protein
LKPVLKLGGLTSEINKQTNNSAIGKSGGMSLTTELEKWLKIYFMIKV